MQSGVSMNINSLGAGSVYLSVESASQGNYPFGEYELEIISNILRAILSDAPRCPKDVLNSAKASLCLEVSKQ